MQGKTAIRRAILDALSKARLARLQIRRAKARLRRLPPQQTRDLIVALETLDIVLEAVVLRLETVLIANMYGVEVLGLPVELIRQVRERTQGFPPFIGELVDTVESALEAVYQTIPKDRDTPLVSEGVKSEAKRILDEAERVARKRLEESLES